MKRKSAVGVVTFSSGTVACAREAAFKGVPAESWKSLKTFPVPTKKTSGQE